MRQPALQRTGAFRTEGASRGDPVVMRNPKPLPVELYGRVFTRAEAVALGVADRRLKARDMTRVARATYRHDPRQGPTEASADAGSTLHRAEFLRAMCSRSSHTWISHVTAAQLYGLLMPKCFDHDARIHLTGVNRSHYSDADPQVVLHRVKAQAADLRVIRGIRVSSPERLLLELSSCLSLTELIVIGDQLVRRPHASLESRTEPWVSLPALRKVVEEGRGRRGAPKVRRALELIRVGADSPPETRMRLALHAAHLPEPELQIPMDPGDRRSPVGDIGYRHERIVIQYDGEHHFCAEQQARDQRRNAQFERSGWAVVLVNRVDLGENFAGMVRRVMSLLERRT